MIRYLACVSIAILLAAGLSEAQPTQTEVIPSVKRSQGKVAGKPGWKQTDWQVKLGRLTLSDRYQYNAAGVLQDKRFFAHSFISPDNGGWSRWGMLRVFLKTAAGKEIGPFPNQPAQTVLPLQGGHEAIVQWLYPLQGAPLPAGVNDQLGIRVCRFAGDPYTYYELSLQSPELTISRVMLEAYPHSTQGEGWQGRQRWVATSAGQSATDKHPSYPGRVGGAFCFNRGAQEDAGTSLLWVPAEVAKVALSGNYSVVTDLTLQPDQRRFRFAETEWVNQPYAEASKEFFSRQLPEVGKRLATMNWRADLSSLPVAHDRQIVADLLKSPPMQKQFSDRVQQLTEQMAKAMATAEGKEVAAARRAEVTYGQLATQYHDLMNEMIQTWLKRGYWDTGK